VAIVVVVVVITINSRGFYFLQIAALKNKLMWFWNSCLQQSANNIVQLMPLPSSLALLKSRMVIFACASNPGCLRKDAVKQMCAVFPSSAEA